MRLLACTLVLTSGCLAHTFAGTGRDDVSTESYNVPLVEQDAALTCAGAPCTGAPVEQPYRRGRSRGEFWTVYLLELGVAAGGLAVGGSQDQALPWLPIHCEGECEVDTGRRIGADAIVSGEVLKVGTRYKLTLKLHDTHDGRLLGGAVASGKTIDELDDSVTRAAMELFGRAQ